MSIHCVYNDKLVKIVWAHDYDELKVFQDTIDFDKLKVFPDTKVMLIDGDKRLEICQVVTHWWDDSLEKKHCMEVRLNTVGTPHHPISAEHKRCKSAVLHFLNATDYKKVDSAAYGVFKSYIKVRNKRLSEDPRHDIFVDSTGMIRPRFRY